MTECGFSDDRRLVSGSRVGLARLVDVTVRGCAATGGCANAQKLLLYSILLRGDKMAYATESALPTLLGELPVRRRGLRLAGVPLVVGEVWTAPVEKAVRRLRLIRAGVLCLQPVYVLAVRICLGYAVSVLDYQFSSRRCYAWEIRGVQGALDAFRARALTAPTPPSSPPPSSPVPGLGSLVDWVVPP